MGKKMKIGKQRRDKFYHLAKEAGYRSRAAFKLIQLNKRFEFLQKSLALVDLCAAPGGWLQVASQNMPLSSIRIGVDLVPIKPINSCITLQGDITTEKTRQMIKRELQSWQADCVLHDGAPNIGLNWIHDAFQQNCLVLSALKLATQILAKNGCFVTKIFRSNDYHSLIEVFEKLFKKVHVWKPAASRLESAEIFVVCEKYFKPTKVDSDLLDPKKVFAETETEKPSNPQLMLQPRKKEKKVKAEGYGNAESLALFKELPASEFIHSRDYLELLSKTNKIILDDERWLNNAATTDEVLHCIDDIKVCGPRELRGILVWRKKLLKSVIGEQKNDKEQVDGEADTEMTEEPKEVEDIEDEELAKIDQEIERAKAEDKADLKKKKKRMLKEKAKIQKRKQLEMIHEGDVQIATEQDLFSIKAIATAKQLANVMNETKTLEHPLDKVKQTDEADDDATMDETNEQSVSSVDTDESDIDGGGDEDDDDESGLLHTEESGMGKEEKLKSRSEKWFSRDGLSELLEDEEDALRTIEQHMDRKQSKVKQSKLHNNTVSFDRGGDNDDAEELNLTTETSDNSKFIAGEGIDDGDDEEEEFHDADKRVAKRTATTNVEPKKELKKRRLTPEALALGEQLIYSSKTRSELEDWAWNRYTNNDDGLPDWFVDDEKKHYRKELPITKEQVERYKERMRELNVRPIKKVAEAKARKRRRALMRLQKAKKKAEGIVDNDDMEHAEKMKEMKKIYRKAVSKEKKQVTYQVMTKSKRGVLSRPSGRFKVVDARLKKDNRREKATNRAANWKKMSSAARRAAMEKKTRNRHRTAA